MIYKNFVVHVIARVLLLIACIFVCCYILIATAWKITPILVFIGIIILVFDLIRYVSKTNRDLASFLHAINYHDFSIAFSDGKRGRSHKELKNAFNTVIKSFNKLKADKESHHMYLQNVVEHVNIALLGFNGDGEIKMMNNAAKQLLQKAYITHLDALERIDPTLRDTIKNAQQGEQQLISCRIQGQNVPLTISVSEFRLQDELVRLVSLQNIQQELDQKEVDAWQKLIRVMTHEIMNSVTPIISLSGALQELLKDEDGKKLHSKEISEDTLEDIHHGIQTIEKRSEGLLTFVQNYRSITKHTTLEFQEVSLQQLVKRLVTLLSPDLEAHGIDLFLDMPEEELTVMADARMIEQLMINLIKNAKEAVLQIPNPIIKIQSLRSDHKILIRVEDNGAGVSSEVAEHIFVPFFTTKEKGSGVGLSISKQIMQQHKGQIRLLSYQKGKTILELEFIGL